MWARGTGLSSSHGPQLSNPALSRQGVAWGIGSVWMARTPSSGATASPVRTRCDATGAGSARANSATPRTCADEILLHRDELRQLTDAQVLSAAEALLDLVRLLPPRPGVSGLVEQQRLFARART